MSEDTPNEAEELSNVTNAFISDCGAYVEIQERLSAHLNQYREDKTEDAEKWEEFMKTQAQNTEAINSLAESTKGLVDAWQAANGVVKVGAALGSFAKWAAGIAVFGTFFTFIFDKVK